MEEILRLLKERNSFLRQFQSVNKAEMFRFESGDFSRLDYFYKSRDNILDMISHLESQLDTMVDGLSSEFALTNEIKNHVRTELEIKDSIITKILDQDLGILELIDHAKNSIIKELRDVSRVRVALNGYSPDTPKRKSRQA